jgi:hypothetical protein
MDLKRWLLIHLRILKHVIPLISLLDIKEYNKITLESIRSNLRIISISLKRIMGELRSPK